jgi:hypothetical protein
VDIGSLVGTSISTRIASARCGAAGKVPPGFSALSVAVVPTGTLVSLNIMSSCPGFGHFCSGCIALLWTSTKLPLARIVLHVSSMMTFWMRRSRSSIRARRVRASFALLVASLCTGCGGDASSHSSGSGDQSQGGQSQGGQSQGGQAQTGGSAGTVADAGQDLGTPLLELPARLAYDCSVSRQVELLNISPWSGGVAIDGGQGPLLLRSESTNWNDARGMGTTTVVSSINVQGARGEPTNVTNFVPGWASCLTTTSVAGVTTALWLQQDLNDQLSYWQAKLNSDGTVLAAPTQLQPSDISALVACPRLAPAPTGYALLFGYVQDQKLRLTLVDNAGVPTVDSKVLLTGAHAEGFLRTSQGFLLAYSNQPLDGSQAETFLMTLDDTGTPTSEPWLLGSNAGSVEFMVRGNEIWAAWVESQGSYSDQTVASTIRIGRFDVNGNRVQSDLRLQRPVEDHAAVDPRWIDFGSDVGLLWSIGSVIYICAGCMPDNHLEFVVLDGTDLTPKSSLLTMSNRSTHGGLLDPSVVRVGDELLVVSSATYHTSAEGTSATIHCTSEK